MARSYFRHRAICCLLSLVILSPLRAAEFDLTSATIAELNAAFDAGVIDSETLVRRYLARIEAYDKQGPAINAVLTLNPDALQDAQALDRERKAKGPRSPLHGIPVVLKDNIDTADLPTTAGSFMLKDSVPPDDAFLVRKLRASGAVILAKLNMSEFASGDALNSLGGPPTTLTTRRAARRVHRVAPAPRSRQRMRRSDSAPIPAVRCACRRRPTVSSA